MSNIRDIGSLLPLPSIDLEAGTSPRSGFSVPLSNFCTKKLVSPASKCHSFYKELAANYSAGVHQCPYGFSACVFHTRSQKMAITGVIPTPRAGGDAEKARAKVNKDQRVGHRELRNLVKAIQRLDERFDNLETRAIEKYSFALHEIKKLNRTVKQTAERLCLDESPKNPDEADSRFVTIWKTAEIMSHQFDIIEILANENLVKLPKNSWIDVYRIFDKCVRIIQHRDRNKLLRIASDNAHSFPKIYACDKTFSIIPTVLIGNAMKYGDPTGPIDVRFRMYEGKKKFSVYVSNFCDSRIDFRPNIFEKGIRYHSDSEGSGNGLYIAQQIARQHDTEIQVQTSEERDGLRKVIFLVQFAVEIQPDF